MAESPTADRDRLRTIDGPGVQLRRFMPSDFDLVMVAFADPDVRRWNPIPGTSSADALAWCERRNDWEGGAHVSWAVGAPDGELLGSISIHRIDQEQSHAEIGYWTGPWARRRGAATAALKVASQVAFGELGLHRLSLFHAVQNDGSCQVATRAGFPLEGLLRQSFRYADGHYYDEHVHGRLAADQISRDAASPTEYC